MLGFETLGEVTLGEIEQQAASNTQTIVGSLVNNVSAFFGATVSQTGGAQTIFGALFANDNTFYSATISAEQVAPSQRGDDAPARRGNGRLPFVYFEKPKARTAPIAPEATPTPQPRQLTRRILRKAIAKLPQGSPLWTTQAVVEAMPASIKMVLPASKRTGPSDEQLAVMVRDWLVAKQDEEDIELLLLAA